MSEIIQLPKTISYSSLSDWNLCPYYYKLVNIDKLKPFTSSVWTYWGTLIHKYLQIVLAKEMTAKDASKRFAKTWKRFCVFYKKNEYEAGKSVLELLKLVDVGAFTVLTINDAFIQQFGKFKVLAIEKRIDVPNGKEWTQNFKGFVDIIIQLEKDNSIVFIDFKSTKSNFYFKKYQDKYKDYQLTLYKHFVCEKEKWNKKNVETFFVCLERNSSSKKPIEFVRVTSGSKKIDNALKWLYDALFFINHQKWIKNKSSCLKYGEKYPCFFYCTEYCK